MQSKQTVCGINNENLFIIQLKSFFNQLFSHFQIEVFARFTMLIERIM